MQVSRDMLCVGRLLHEDDRFITLEVAKSDDVSFTLDEDTPDQFHTVLFVRADAGGAEVWKPWEQT